MTRGKKDNKPQDGAEGSSEQTTDKGSNWVWNRKEEQKQDQGGWKKKEGWVPSGCFTVGRVNGQQKIFLPVPNQSAENIADAEDFGPTTEKDGQDYSCNVEQRVPEMITGMESYQRKAVQYWDHISKYTCISEILPPLPFSSAVTFANIMCHQPLMPPLSSPSAKLMIMALEEYGYQSRRGIQERECFDNSSVALIPAAGVILGIESGGVSLLRKDVICSRVREKDPTDCQLSTPNSHHETEEVSYNEDVDEWLNAEMSKRMIRQDKDEEEEALIDILKTVVEECKSIYKKAQIPSSRTSEINLQRKKMKKRGCK
ncbi:hypothetical protein Tco_0207030 [Tanacetum coccineum]